MRVTVSSETSGVGSGKGISMFSRSSVRGAGRKGISMIHCKRSIPWTSKWSRGKALRKTSFRSYIHTIMHQIDPKASVSTVAMNVVNSMVKDLFIRIAEEAARILRYWNRATCTHKEIRYASQIVLPMSMNATIKYVSKTAVLNYTTLGRK